MSETGPRVLRLGYDLSILRHPLGGTQRYAVELLRAMGVERSGRTMVPLAGWPRAGRRGPLAARVRRTLNLGIELGWLCAGSAWSAVRHDLDVWYSPANLLPAILPRPKVVTIHDLNFLTAPGTYDAGYTRYASAAFRLTAHSAAGVIAVSDHTRRTLIELLDVPKDRVSVCYPGVDHTMRVRALADAGLPRPYALYVGQTEPHKNVGLLIEAWRAGVSPDLNLVIAGPAGRDDARLRRMVASGQLRSRVVFAGPLAEARLAAAYRDAEMFLFPSLAEGFGFPPLEAMKRGVPTAVADAASLPEVTAGGALLFDPRDPVALGELVERLRDDGPLRAMLSTEGKRVADRYSWASTARGTWAAILAAVAR